jgi:hypothetical protein
VQAAAYQQLGPFIALLPSDLVCLLIITIIIIIIIIITNDVLMYVGRILGESRDDSVLYFHGYTVSHQQRRWNYT